MKITILINSLSGGGAERVVCNLSNYLAEEGHDITVLSFSGKKTYYLSEKVTHIPLYDDVNKKGNYLVKNVLRIYRMIKYFRNETPDAYITFLPPLSYVMLSQKKYIKCPIILTERNNPESYCAVKKNKKQYSKYYPMADAFVFQTKDAQMYYNQCLNLKKKYEIVIPNAINDEFVKDVYEGEREKVIVSVGRMTAQKNFSLLIKAFTNIKDEFPDYRLRIFGNGDLLESYKSLCKELNVEERVEFPGYVKDIGNKIKNASLFVLPSDYEGMPNALMEAMALGLPCISTDCPVGGPKFLIENNKNGILTEVGDEEQMTEAIRTMLSNIDKALSMGKEAHKICERFPSDKVYSQWEGFIYRVINQEDAL